MIYFSPGKEAKKKKWDWRDSIALALHAADPYSIPSITRSNSLVESQAYNSPPPKLETITNISLGTSALEF